MLRVQSRKCLPTFLVRETVATEISTRRRLNNPSRSHNRRLSSMADASRRGAFAKRANQLIAQHSTTQHRQRGPHRVMGAANASLSAQSPGRASGQGPGVGGLLVPGKPRSKPRRSERTPSMPGPALLVFSAMVIAAGITSKMTRWKMTQFS